MALSKPVWGLASKGDIYKDSKGDPIPLVDLLASMIEAARAHTAHLDELNKTKRNAKQVKAAETAFFESMKNFYTCACCSHLPLITDINKIKKTASSRPL